MTQKFIVDDLGELLALQRVFREAKFCTEPDDTEISDSPVVARLYELVIATLVAKELEIGREDAGVRWREWLRTSELRDEWHAAMRRAKADGRWRSFSAGEQIEHAKLLLSPFVLSRDDIEKFVSEVNRSSK